MKYFLIIAISFLSYHLFSYGIIIGNDTLVQQIFQTYNSEQIADLANDLSYKYNKVVLHVGRKFPFAKGNFFESAKSKENLIVFADYLRKRDVPFYIWFLDSYGSKGFKEMYDSYVENVDNLIYNLKNLKVKYNGFVVDMEWINKPYGNNAEKFEEILKYIKSKAPKKELYTFISIIDNPDHNLERGYNEAKILSIVDGIWPMLYPLDGGFYLDYGKIKLRVKDNRINDMRNYFDSCQYDIVFSIEEALLQKKWLRINVVKSLNKYHPVFDSLKMVHKDDYHYYSISKFKAKNDFFIETNSGEKLFVKRNKKLYFYQIKPHAVRPNDLIWEFLYVKDFELIDY